MDNFETKLAEATDPTTGSLLGAFAIVVSNKG